MKKLFLAGTLFISFNSFAQYDTSYILKTFQYIQTDKFKEEFTDTSIAEARKRIAELEGKRKNRWERKELKDLLRWANGPRSAWTTALNCFQLNSKYMIPDPKEKVDSAILKIDSLYKSKFIFKPLTISESNSKSNPCSMPLLLTGVFLSSDILEMKYFVGQSFFGQEMFLRFKINDDRSVRFLRLRPGAAFN